jgi:hypothetical protein
MTVPNPTMLARIAQQKQAAAIQPDAKAKVVRPGTVAEQVTYIHDGVVKSKNLEPGMNVRPYVHGQPRGAERIVKSVERVGNGAMVKIEFVAGFDPQERAAAYRWYCEALDGATATRTVRKPALVPYLEV